MKKINNLLIFKYSKIKKYIIKNFTTSEIQNLIPHENICGDKIFVVFKDVKPKIKGIRFTHEGCILSKAVTNLLLTEIDNKTQKEAIFIIKNFLNLMKNKKYTLSENLLFFHKYLKFSTRVNCMRMPAEKIMNLLNEK